MISHSVKRKCQIKNKLNFSLLLAGLPLRLWGSWVLIVELKNCFDTRNDSTSFVVEVQVEVHAKRSRLFIIQGIRVEDRVSEIHSCLHSNFMDGNYNSVFFLSPTNYSKFHGQGLFSNFCESQHSRALFLSRFFQVPKDGQILKFFWVSIAFPSFFLEILQILAL